jgi:hypothetical protein
LDRRPSRAAPLARKQAARTSPSHCSRKRSSASTGVAAGHRGENDRERPPLATPPPHAAPITKHLVVACGWSARGPRGRSTQAPHSIQRPQSNLSRRRPFRRPFRRRRRSRSGTVRTRAHARRAWCGIVAAIGYVVRGRNAGPIPPGQGVREAGSSVTTRRRLVEPSADGSCLQRTEGALCPLCLRLADRDRSVRYMGV